jgi:hypothetical protein
MAFNFDLRACNRLCYAVCSDGLSVSAKRAAKRRESSILLITNMGLRHIVCPCNQADIFVIKKYFYDNR